MFNFYKKTFIEPSTLTLMKEITIRFNAENIMDLNNPNILDKLTQELKEFLLKDNLKNFPTDEIKIEIINTILKFNSPKLKIIDNNIDNRQILNTKNLKSIYEFGQNIQEFAELVYFELLKLVDADKTLFLSDIIFTPPVTNPETNKRFVGILVNYTTE